MIKVYRVLMVLGILMLTIMGLNTSNQGINSLTLQNRSPILGWDDQGSAVSVFTLGESHSYGKQELVTTIIQAGNRVCNYAREVVGYIIRIVKIMKIIFIS